MATDEPVAIALNAKARLPSGTVRTASGEAIDQNIEWAQEHQRVIAFGKCRCNMAHNKQGYNGEQKPLQLHLRHHYHQRQRHYSNHPGVHRDEQTGARLADIKVGGNVGEQADRHKLGGVEHEHGKGKPYKGQPSGKRFFVLHPKNKMYYLLSFLRCKVTQLIRYNCNM